MCVLSVQPLELIPLMQKRISKLAGSLKRIGDIEVNDWDFMELLHKDIRDLEVARSLRRLGKMRVTEWEFKDVLPAVNKLAHKEVDLGDIFRRAAAYRVMEWDFREAFGSHHDGSADSPRMNARKPPSTAEIGALSARLTRFLASTAHELIEEPAHAQVMVREIQPAVLCFTMVLLRRDAATLIGHGGHTAAAIRRLMQAVGLSQGVHVLLRVLSHEEFAREEPSQTTGS